MKVSMRNDMKVTLLNPSSFHLVSQLGLVGALMRTVDALTWSFACGFCASALADVGTGLWLDGV